jgi:hypothetical protein
MVVLEVLSKHFAISFYIYFLYEMRWMFHVDHRVPALSRLASGTLGGLLFAVNYVVV